MVFEGLKKLFKFYRFSNYRDYRERERRIDGESSFEELLLKDDSVTIQQQHLRVLAVEMYEISHKLSPEFMLDLAEEINTKPGQVKH